MKSRWSYVAAKHRCLLTDKLMSLLYCSNNVETSSDLDEHPDTQVFWGAIVILCGVGRLWVSGALFGRTPLVLCLQTWWGLSETLFLCWWEHFTDRKYDEYKWNLSLRCSVRARAGLADTRTHLSAERSHWLIIHKYPDSVLCTRQSRKDGLKFLPGCYVLIK